MSKIWLISEFYYPILTSTGYYITEIAEYLASQGLDVNVICTSSKYNEVDIKYNFKKYEEHNGVKIHRIVTPQIDKNHFIKRIVRLSWLSILIFIMMCRKISKKDKVLAVTNPAFLLILLPAFKKIKQVKYSILVHDIFPENLVAVQKVNNKTLAYALLKKLFDRAYYKADKLISIGRDMTRVLQNKTKGRVKIELIPNWADNEILSCSEKEETKIFKSLNLKEKFIFQFAGNIGHAQGIENLLTAIKIIEDPGIHFLFIGGGAKVAEIEKFILSENLKNISLVGFQDRSNQNDFLNACDVSIITLSDGMFGLGVPSKSYNIMAVGKPFIIIADVNSEIAICCKEHDLGWVVEPKNPELLAQKILEIYNSDATLHRKSKNNLRVANTIFSKKVILDKYYNFIIKE